MKIKKISHYKNTLGEGAWWDNKLQLLYWTDILEGKLYTYDPNKKIETLSIIDEIIKELSCVNQIIIIPYDQRKNNLYKVNFTYKTWNEILNDDYNLSENKYA